MAHLWSLAQEEQYYVVWPIALIAIMLSRRPLVWAAALAAAAVVTPAMLALSSHDLNALYYLPTGHSQGLLIGSLLGLWRFRRGLAVSGDAALGWLAIGAIALLITNAGPTAGFFVCNCPCSI